MKCLSETSIRMMNALYQNKSIQEVLALNESKDNKTLIPK